MARSTIGQYYPTAFLTGASTGLGRAFAEMLLGEGVRVWGTARDAARLTGLASQYPVLFTPVIFDLADPAAGDAAFERAAKSAGGAFDLVINNAGYGVFSGFETAEFRTWEAQLQTMLIATLRVSYAALRGMRRRNGGCLVNVSSLAVDFPLPYMSGYNVAKAGLSAFTESLIVETRGTGITVVDFRPGDFRTGFNQTMQPANLTDETANAAIVRAWRTLEKNLQTAPLPAVAAEGLRRALLRRRSGMVRVGSFFQTRVAPFFTDLMPRAMKRWVAARYFDL